MTIKNFLLTLLFPTYCVICEKPGKYLCQECFKFVPIKSGNLCPVCQKAETFAGRICNVCENEGKKFYLNGIIVASYYKHPILKDIVRYYKYGFIRELALPLSKILLHKLFILETFPFEKFVFTAVPLHKKRRAWRGFNQSELLAERLQITLSRNGLDITFLPNLLIRQRYVKPQMKIHSTKDRKKNVIGNFSLNEAFLKRVPHKIILIDDIATTGATLNECAKVLKSHGARTVWGLVLARQGR